MGPIWCTREAIPHFKTGHGGHIIFVSSESVSMPFPYLAVYVATKAGLEAFAAGLRTELRPDGVRVTVLRLGNTGDTAITDRWSKDIKAEYFAHVGKTGHLAMVGALAKPASVAAALVGVLSLPNDVNANLFDVRSR